MVLVVALLAGTAIAQTGLILTETRTGGAAELKVETGSVVVRRLSTECVVDVPALGITNRRKTQDRWVLAGVPVGVYAGRLAVGPTTLPVSFGACTDDTASLFGAFVGSYQGGEVTSAARLGPDEAEWSASAGVIEGAGEQAVLVAPSTVRLTSVRLGSLDAGTRLVSFDVGWDESWRGPDRPSWVTAPDNRDAVWVFVKYRVDGGAWQHATLASGGHVAPAGSVVSVSSDGMGAFVYRSSSGYGAFVANGVGLAWDVLADGVRVGGRVEVAPFAIEMVYVPEGSFSVGSGGSSPGEFRAGGTSNTPFVVNSQAPIGLGNSSGQLMWTTRSSLGSPSGSTHASFPTGFGAFYVMKHQVTQGQYVNFLNTLTQAQADARKHTASDFRYAITGDRVGSYATSLPFLAMNYLSWADGAAFADWAGLRPLTELEFEKVARGPLAPVANEFAWGSTSITQATGLASAGSASETPTPAGANAAYGSASGVQGPVRVGSFAAPGRSRRDAGAGFYGALELSGNLWERAVTVGNAEGRAFAGTHGDGVLDASGNANAPSWPGATAVGTGFRGGCWFNDVDDLRVSLRFFAESTYAFRDFNFGWRGARSAP